MVKLGAVAELERETIRERTYGGKLRRAKEGRHLGHAPFGYRAVEGGQGGVREVVAEEAAKPGLHGKGGIRPESGEPTVQAGPAEASPAGHTRGPDLW